MPLNILTLRDGKVPPAWYKKPVQSKCLCCQGGETLLGTGVLTGRCIAGAVGMAAE